MGHFASTWPSRYMASLTTTEVDSVEHVAIALMELVAEEPRAMHCCCLISRPSPAPSASHLLTNIPFGQVAVEEQSLPEQGSAVIVTGAYIHPV